MVLPAGAAMCSTIRDRVSDGPERAFDGGVGWDGAPRSSLAKGLGYSFHRAVWRPSGPTVGTPPCNFGIAGRLRASTPPNMIRTLTLLALALPVGELAAQEAFHCGNDEIDRIGAPIAQAPDFVSRVAQRTTELEAFTRTFEETGERGGGGFVIPVVFHIIHNNGPENISDAQVRDAIRVLNLDFNRLNTDWDNVRPQFQAIVADIGVEFRLATKDPQGNCTNGITRTVSPLTNAGNSEMKALISWPRDRYMQIWVAASADGAAGYTFRPGTADWIPQEDGIVMQHTYVGAIGTSSVNRSRSLTHEVGHWLNLAHTWGNSNEPGLDSNCDMDDGVSDTPNTRGWTSCTLNGASCGSALDNVENYMEYSYCSKMFTEGQKIRMIAALNSGTAERNQLWQTNNLINTGVNGNATLCAARFSVNRHEVCAGNAVVYTDESYHNVTSRTWSFPGGEPATSTEPTVTVYYPTGGTYPVTLEATDGASIVSTTEQNVVVVLNNPGQAPPVAEGFESAAQPAELGWTVVNNDGDNSYGITNTAAYSGSKSIRIQNNSTMVGRLDQLITSTYDMSEVSDIVLSFRYAYARRTNSNADQLRVFVSNNCGESWSLRGQLFATSDLNTGGVVGGNFVPNGPGQWGFKEIATINSTYQVSNMRIRFDYLSDGGNNLYIDDINLNGTPVALGRIELGAGGATASIVPNPTSAHSDLRIRMADTDRVRLDLLDVTGRLVSTFHDGVLTTGEHRIAIPVEGQAHGIFFVRITTTEGVHTERLVKQ